MPEQPARVAMRQPRRPARACADAPCAPAHADALAREPGLHQAAARACADAAVRARAQTRTPEYLVWIKRISYVAYGYSGLIKNEFTGLRLTAPGGFEVEARSLIPPNIENGLDIGRDAWVLVGILVGMRIITFFQMLVSIRLRWL